MKHFWGIHHTNERNIFGYFMIRKKEHILDNALNDEKKKCIQIYTLAFWMLGRENGLFSKLYRALQSSFIFEFELAIS
jgi:hypothetical protein